MRISSSTYVSSSQPSGLKMDKRISKFFSKSACSCCGSNTDFSYFIFTRHGDATVYVASMVSKPLMGFNAGTKKATSFTANPCSISIRWTKSPSCTKLRRPSFVRLEPRICTVVYTSFQFPETFSRSFVGSGSGLIASSCSANSAIASFWSFFRPKMPRSTPSIAARSASLAVVRLSIDGPARTRISLKTGLKPEFDRRKLHIRRWSESFSHVCCLACLDAGAINLSSPREALGAFQIRDVIGAHAGRNTTCLKVMVCVLVGDGDMF
mmetsp:Transcript_7785/g.14709  ORF Transcript_7785/g.14709 Transcript_7785/m.14709 type:complete len:267 (+) Transcript_7785:133-933(+)